ncbi:type IV conjugative transfer system protein TraE [Motilimonas eburnea]|uniref:type IV conjugative transfer system protein TraE n=1 Tax=Motilimonas eburnea TaxID=1737488 RepID=UPI001E2A8EA4|nr:type IV conjugative transfer system protein TraE [Motilimonas eburnea]MCE2571746.1 type IV conjugative transfer system protein TraE [Motilimonas eburnea]
MFQNSRSKSAKSWSNAVSAANINALAVLVLALGLVIALVVILNKDTKTIMTSPTYKGEKIEVIGNKANSNWKKGWSLYLAILIGNVGPKNVELVVSEINSYLSPRLKRQKKEEIEKFVAMLKARNAEQTFVPQDMAYDPKQDVVWVWGELSVSTMNNKSPTPQRWTYEFKVLMDGLGSPRVTFLDQYSGAPKINRKRKKDDDVSVKLREDQYYDDEMQDVVASAEGEAK